MIEKKKLFQKMHVMFSAGQYRITEKYYEKYLLKYRDIF